MSNYHTGKGGHAAGHVRDTFLSSVEAYTCWDGTGPEPLAGFEVNYEQRQIPISKACGLVWNCLDILPGNVWTTLIDHDINPAAAHTPLRQGRCSRK